jgi:hypothetical protein
MWRMAKLAGGIDATVKFIETVIATTPTLKFRNIAGKEMPIRDLAGLARSVQAGTSVPQGALFDLRDVQFLENKFIAIQADMNAMLAQLAGAVPCTDDIGKQEQSRRATSEGIDEPVSG